MRIWRHIGTLLPIMALGACATSHEAHAPHEDLGQRWVKSAVEYQAISAQAYAVATRDLARFVDDTSWTAMPGQPVDPSLPPAVILDIDETVVSNVDFQLSYEPPFANSKLDTWSSNTKATPINGVVAFVGAARAAGVEVFFVTNRPCQIRVGTNDPCPQKQTTLEDIRELGIEVDARNVSLSGERDGWDREKLIRRQHIATTHRVIMLIGDDFGDFVPCSRTKVVAPCQRPATAASRAADLEKYRDYFGNGWYILPNPMHGSWTSAQ